MRLVEDELPGKGERVFAYCEDGTTYLARYGRFLTWGGYKMKWINVMGSGHIIPRKVIGWNRAPTKEQTI
jgi:hypothetical protein